MSYEAKRDKNPPCPRCPNPEMSWIKSSWYCEWCRYKEGCCG